MIGILKNKTNSPSQLGDTHSFGANTINQDLTLRWLEKPIEVFHERGFTSAVLTHYGNEFAISDLKGHALQGFYACLVREMDVFDLYQRRKTSFKY
jgi:hypothetical protein